MSYTGTETTAVEHLIGRVKWFNNKVGYGFITITDGNRSGSDIFVHHSAINVENQQYKYLVQGEYVEFDLVKTDSQQHEWQGSNIIGIKGGKLMCETRRDLKIARSQYRNDRPDRPDRMVDTAQHSNDYLDQQNKTQMQEQRNTMPRQRNPRQRNGNSSVLSRGSGDKKDWTVVSRKPRKSNDRYSK